jgi:hypothetical protein
MRSSIAAQSCASVPPAPAWMSRKQLSGSAGLLNMRRNSSAGDFLLDAVDVGEDRLQRLVVAFLARHGEQLAGVAQAVADAVRVSTTFSSERFWRPSSCARSALSQTFGSSSSRARAIA